MFNAVLLEPGLWYVKSPPFTARVVVLAIALHVASKSVVDIRVGSHHIRGTVEDRVCGHFAANKKGVKHNDQREEEEEEEEEGEVVCCGLGCVCFHEPNRSAIGHKVCTHDTADKYSGSHQKGSSLLH